MYSGIATTTKLFFVWYGLGCLTFNTDTDVRVEVVLRIFDTKLVNGDGEVVETG